MLLSILHVTCAISEVKADYHVMCPRCERGSDCQIQTSSLFLLGSKALTFLLTPAVSACYFQNTFHSRRRNGKLCHH